MRTEDRHAYESGAWLFDRTHGLRATYAAGCRCDPCREANTIYSRNLQGAKGRPEQTGSRYQVAQVTNWIYQAACREHEYPDEFHTEKEREQDALAPVLNEYCKRCPVKKECRAYIDEDERSKPTSLWFGFWAGEWKRDRARRRRIRLRPGPICCGHPKDSHDSDGFCMAMRCRCTDFEEAA